MSEVPMMASGTLLERVVHQLRTRDVASSIRRSYSGANLLLLHTNDGRFYSFSNAEGPRWLGGRVHAPNGHPTMWDLDTGVPFDETDPVEITVGILGVLHLIPAGG